MIFVETDRSKAGNKAARSRSSFARYGWTVLVVALSGGAGVMVAFGIRSMLTWTDRTFPADGAHAEVVCLAPLHDFGEVEHQELKHSFLIENRSSSAVDLSVRSKSCGCITVVPAEQTVAPGAAANVTVHVQVVPRRAGARTEFREEFSLAVVQADQGAGDDHTSGHSMTLALRGHYVPPLYYESLQLTLEFEEGAPTAECSTGIYLNARRGVELVAAEPEGSLVFDVTADEAVPSADGIYSRHMLSLSSKRGAQTLPSEGTLLLRTTSRAVPEVRIPVIAYESDRSGITATPQRLAFGVLERGSVASIDVHVRSRQEFDEQLSVRSATSVPGLTVSESQDAEASAGAIVLRCELDTSAFIGNMGLADECRIILSGSKGDWTLRIPVSAFIKSPAAGEL